MPSNWTMREPSGWARADSTTSVRPAGSGSPLGVPTTRRRPAANTAAGASVIGWTTRAPLIPCALRSRPTIRSSGAGAPTSLRVAHRHVAALAPRRDALLVPGLEQPRLAEQRAHGVARQRAHA